MWDIKMMKGYPLYTEYEINNKPTFIFDKHNMAIPIWGKYASKYGALHLFTIDSHTDTHSAFAKYLRSINKQANYNYKDVLQYPEINKLLSTIRYRRDDFSFEDVYNYSQKIVNTEQILTGVAFGYIESYIVRSRSKGYEDDDRRFGYDATYLDYSDTSIPLIREPFALDIDLDFFKSKNEMGKEFADYLEPIFKKACVVTVAREKEFFNQGRNEEGFTVEMAEERLIQIMKEYR